MDSRTGEMLDVHHDKKLMRHLTEEQQQQTEREYLENLENDLRGDGVPIGQHIYGIHDADMEFIGSESYMNYLMEFGKAGLDCGQINRQYQSIKDRWITEHYVPYLAEELSKAEIGCMGFDEDMA